MQADTHAAKVADQAAPCPRSERPPRKSPPSHPAVTAAEAFVSALMGIRSAAERREHRAGLLAKLARMEHDEARQLRALEAEVHPGYDACEALASQRAA